MGPQLVRARCRISVGVASNRLPSQVAAFTAATPIPRLLTASSAAAGPAARRHRAICSCTAGSPDSAADGGDKKQRPHPTEVLRVSRGTDFQGLLNARKVAREEAQGDEEKLEMVEWAFDKFISASRSRFEKTVVDNPDDADALYQLGNFYQTTECFDDAERLYREALQKDAGHLDSMNNLALLLQHVRKDLDGAEELYKKALEAQPNDVDLLFNYATLMCFGREDIEGMKVLIERIVEIRPDMAEHPLVLELRK